MYLSQPRTLVLTLNPILRPVTVAVAALCVCCLVSNVTGSVTITPTLGHKCFNGVEHEGRQETQVGVRAVAWIRVGNRGRVSVYSEE